MIADMLSNKNLNPIVTELFIRDRKLNISLVFIAQSYSAMLKNIRLKSTHYFIMKTPNKQELQQITFNHSSDIEFKDFMKFYKNILQVHIIFKLLMLLLHQIILYISERIFQKEYKKYS